MQGPVNELETQVVGKTLESVFYDPITYWIGMTFVGTEESPGDVVWTIKLDAAKSVRPRDDD